MGKAGSDHGAMRSRIRRAQGMVPGATGAGRDEESLPAKDSGHSNPFDER